MENDAENTLIIELSTGEVVIELFPDVAPLHVERIKTLTREGEYDDVAFHRVIDGFVAQTGDVQFGDLEDGYDPFRVGTGGSDLPDLPLEPSDISFERGIVGMARAQALDSANSQFFIVTDDATFLDGAYTAFGRVTEGIEFVDQIKQGDPAANGLVTDPDRMVDVEILADQFDLGLTLEEAQEVALLYEAGLDRDGEIDEGGLNFWIDRREDGLSQVDLAQRFLDSDEFEDAFGEPESLSDQELVEQLYRNVLDREGEQGGVAFWTDRVGDADFTRANLLLAFARSPENREGSAFVDDLMEIEPGEWAFA